jgi:hypothetical protein
MKGSAVVVGVLALTAVSVGVAMAASSSDKPGSFSVTGKSGTAYTVKFVKAFTLPDGRKQSFWDVFVGPLRILRYSQLESDRDSRVFIVSPLGPTDPRVGVAMADFGITFVGGPLAELVSTTATPAPLLAGQVVVSPGSWMATADVGGLKALVVSASLIRDALKEQGWRQVNVMTTAPANWPLSKNGNYFIEAVWSGPPRIFQVPAEVVDIRSRALA